jgi:general secretion pathway protein C
MTALSRRALVWAAAAVAAASIGLAAIPLPRRFAGDSGLPPPQPGILDAAPQPDLVESILAWAPFGRPAPAEDGPAPETSLGLTLHGVVIATDPEPSSAILSGASAPAQSYAVGQEIAPGAMLAEVHGDHVVLIVQGRRETLAFPDARPEPVADGGVADLRALVTGSEDAPAALPAGNDADEIAGFRDRLRDDPQALLDDLGLVATGEGYRVADGASETLLRTGLQPGDLVARVNGQQVGNIEQDMDLFDEVTASGRARMDLVRNGQRLVLSFPLR